MVCGMISWLDPWIPVEGEERRRALDAELRRELTPGHALFDQPATAIGGRTDRDDVLFATSDDRLAEVHLTWSGRAENAPLPTATVYISATEWIDRSMRRANSEL
jgi:hypothetical protein